ncbi:hypothetical protein GCM10010116_51650 [Microbispora rosea subsp. aerata]|nr:hypothetical protein [Microbispora rosea]GGO25737.1 hypothetical protein GCM10010116_51650 [Microbispora rosea subsp. aerata]GIH56908.1 hypothetical protein Mro02_38220 [Microbispora rosea subsp. aerata]GLJ82834.1 hypothetical protein GCM10017588_15600 [Microbispora rosea subsp. aerata]
MSRALWLASACPAAIVMPKLRRGEAAPAQALTTGGVAGSAAFGAFARPANYGKLAHRPVHVNRPMSDEQIRTAVRGGAQGPHDAWRGPVIP